jgi:hypothetical protein
MAISTPIEGYAGGDMAMGRITVKREVNGKI